MMTQFSKRKIHKSRGIVKRFLASWARPQMVLEITHASGAPLKLLGPVPKFSATPARVQSPPPLLGQHTEEVLKELLKMSTLERKILLFFSKNLIL
jgi:crotonobetainyl-CoA:carnitine CoA-transferase CaiB-like acyl-CoA transferase